MLSILLKLDRKNTLLDLLKQDFIQFNSNNEVFLSCYSNIVEGLEKVFNSLPQKYSKNFEIAYSYLDAIEYCKKVLKFSLFYKLNIIENYKINIFSFHFSKNGNKNCLSILPFITDSKSNRKLIYSSDNYEVYIMLSEKFYLDEFEDYLPVLTGWKKLYRVANVLGKSSFKLIVQRYLEFCFQEFIGFTHLDFLGNYGREGILDINTYLINLILDDLGHPDNLKIKEKTPLTVEAYKEFLKTNCLNKSIWSDMFIFNKFYKFIEDDLNLIEVAENRDK